MASVDARTLASLLREYAQRTALRGGNPYRAKAYSRAADSLTALAVPLHVFVAEDRLTELPGVGEAIADIITKLHKTGTHPSLEKLRKEIPEGVLEMLAVPGLRPEKVLRLHKDLGVASLAELEAAAKDDRIKKAKGLGASLQTKILQNLDIAKNGEGRLHLHRAAALLAHAKDSIRKSRPELKRVTIAGEFRRGCELVGMSRALGHPDRVRHSGPAHAERLGGAGRRVACGLMGFPMMLCNRLHGETAHIVRGLRMIGDPEILETALARSLGRGLKGLGPVGGIRVAVKDSAQVFVGDQLLRQHPVQGTVDFAAPLPELRFDEGRPRAR